MYRLILILLCLTMLAFLNSCSIIKTMAGANIDAEQFEYYRKAKSLEIQSKNATILRSRLSNGDPITNADIYMNISKEMLIQIISQYQNMSGVMDSQNSYVIDSVSLKLNYGSAVISFGMKAYNSKYDVNLFLNMDCLLSIELEGNDLVTSVEPFNISPKANAKGVLALSEEIIENLVKVNLSNLNKNFPPMKIPVNLSGNFPIPGNDIVIRDRVNMKISNPKRDLSYNLKIKDILIFEDQVFVSLNLNQIGVK